MKKLRARRRKDAIMGENNKVERGIQAYSPRKLPSPDILLIVGHR